ncbi:hypothetical protein TB2_023303 [Malus domestica]
MAGVQDQLEIKFRLTDGSDIGPKSFPAATSVVNLKESILAQWPKEKDNGPRTVKDVKLISAGRILENNRTVAECRSPLCDVPGGVTTMHVVVQPPSQEKAQIVGITSFLGEGELELIKENEMDQLADRFSSIGIMQASCHMSCVGAGIGKALDGVATVLRYALRCVVQQNAMPSQLGP